ncbi:hypothetical protein EHS25_006029 [Saitozyma podzolica]|uniref:BTB domain-containing protein n=1 Tax=Saitozyma podzolica TaxID=1890683 RepID=A0A427XU13_9TREE|nr:hypothetical protein EHS25_006029 [Saitozyma podzolica]
MASDCRASPKYNDPTADVVLESTDKVLFRVHSYLLKASSTVFRDMFDLNASPLILPTPIPFESSSSDLTLFLDFMTQAIAGRRSDWTHLKRVALLSEKFDCAIILDRITSRLHRLVQSAPWEIFVFAAQRDELPLAKEALGAMNHDKRRHRMSLETVSADWFREVPLGYTLGLMAALGAFAVNHKRNMSPGMTENGWKVIGTEFKPVE